MSIALAIVEIAMIIVGVAAGSKFADWLEVETGFERIVLIATGVSAFSVMGLLAMFLLDMFTT